MKKLKIILLFSIILYIFYIVKNDIYTTKYQQNENEITGKIVKITVKENRTVLIVKGKEKVLVNYYNSLNYELGDEIKVVGELNIPNKNTTMNLFNYQNYLKAKKIYWTMTADNIILIKNNNNLLYKIKNYLYKSLNNPYLFSFILGDNSFIEEEVKTSYQINGISHLFAISGMHITFITTVLLFIFSKLFNNKNLIIIIISLFLLIYNFLVCFTPSIIRASLLFIILNFKKFNSKEILVFIAFILLLYNPYYIYDLGFKYSFIVSFFLIQYQKQFNKSYFLNLLLVSTISFVASIPIQINYFFQINLLTIVYNLIFVPFVSLIIFPLSFLVIIFTFLEPIFNYFLITLQSLSLFLSKINLMIIIPKLPVILILIYYLLIYKLNKIKILIIIIFFFFYTNINYFNKNASITFFDVGNGDSILISLPYNKGNILIDTGGNIFSESNYYVKNTIIPYLKQNGIKKIDYLILTHGDIDHIKETEELLNNFKVKKILLNNFNNEMEQKILDKYSAKNIGDYKILLNNYQINIINYKNINENNDSLIVYTKINNKNILLMADATKEEEIKLLRDYNIENVDILKLGHHGSKTSSNKEFLTTLNPKYSVISSGKNNIYGHPHKETIENLKEITTKVFMTSNSGTIKMILKNKIEIITCQ